MNVCIVSKMFPPGVGGAETYAYELANALGKLGHTVDVYTQSVSDHDEEVAIHSNVTVTRLCSARKKLVVFETLYFSLKSRPSIDFSQYDIVHGTLMPASTIALTPGFGMSDIPIVATSHGTSIDEALSNDPAAFEDYLLKYFFHPINVIMDGIAGRSADSIIAISRHAANRLAEFYRFDETRIEYVPHGVDTDTFSPDVATHPAISEDKFTALYVGRLSPRKGLDMAVDALASVQSEVELVIAGTGRHKDSLYRRAEARGIEDRINFLDYVPKSRLPSLYASADIFVLTSTYEGFGLVVLEAMACGTPVIGTAVGGITDIIRGTTDGYLIPRDPSVLADRIDRLADDKSLLNHFGKNAREHAEQMDWQIVAEKVETIYEDQFD